MLPLMLDVARLRLILVGNGAAALKRLRLLDEAGASALTVHADAPSGALSAAAGSRLRRFLPAAHDLAAAQLLFVADPAPKQRATLVAAARAAGIIVHVEDEPLLSDAQAPAVLRQGALTIAVSTGGASPTLAARLKRFLGEFFGPEWRERLDEVAALRRHWREAGATPAIIALRTDEWISRRGWLEISMMPPGLLPHIAQRRHCDKQSNDQGGGQYVSKARRNRTGLHARVDPGTDPLL
jgi:precorrin-2 dehydrogenase/sirohydrochlorin ferrochelatase